MNKQTSCDCVEKLNQLVKRDYDPEGYLETKTGININTGETWPEFPQLNFRYRVKNAKGEFTKKWKTSFFMMAYCPVCGKAKQTSPQPPPASGPGRG